MPNPQKAVYLALYDRWLRTGNSGLAPSPLPFGLLSGDASHECADLEKKIIPSGMSDWSFFDPEYHIPLQFIRRLACFLDLNSDDAAAEWHQWTLTHSRE